MYLERLIVVFLGIFFLQYYLYMIILLPLLTLGLLLSTAGSNSSVTEQKFLSPPYDKTIYIDVSLNDKFKSDGDNLYLHCFNDSTNQQTEIVSLISDGNDIYHSSSKILIDFLSFEQCYFEICCSDETYVSERVSTSLLKKQSYNYLCVDDDACIKGYGYYGQITNNPGATYKTQRVWLNNENQFFYENDEWGSPCTNVVCCDYDFCSLYISMESIKNSFDNKIYYYVDIPSEITSIHFLRMANSDNHRYLIYEDIYIQTLTYGSCYFAGIIDYEDYKNIKTSVVSGADAVLLSTVLEAYLTYGENFSNGCKYTTVKNLFDTWFKHKSATSEDLKNIKFLDYSGYSKNGNSYEGLNKNVSFSVYEKWNALCTKTSIDPNTGIYRKYNTSWFNKESSKVILIVGGTIILTIGAFVVFIIIKKRKAS